MNILLVNWQDPANPEAGGAEVHLQEIFTRLVGYGHDVAWLASGWTGASRQEQSNGLELHRTGSRYTFGLAVGGYYRRHLADRKFDVVVEALNKVPVFTPIWADRPVGLIVHHLFGATAFHEASFPLAAATWLLERPIPHVYADVPVQAISESTRDDLIDRGLPPAHVSVVHPGVNLRFFTPDPSTTRFATPTFLYLGRLRRYKRVDLILRAHASLAAAGVETRVVIAGKGDDERRLRKLACDLGTGDSVEFRGFVTEELKRDLLRSAWANVFVSSKEGWGITNLEAAACGTPTIAADAPGLRESVADGRSGVLVPDGDLSALIRAMHRFATDRALVETLGGQAAAFAARFTWDRAARRTEELLNEVALRARMR